MPQSLLNLVQDACAEISLTPPTSVISTTDQQALQFTALANGLGKELARLYQWQGLELEHQFAGQAVTSSGVASLGGTVITGIPSTAGLTDDYLVISNFFEVNTRVVTVNSATQITVNLPATANGAVDITFSKDRYLLPTTYQSMVNETQWDRTNNWPLLGPKTPQEWAWIRGGIISTGPRSRFRILGDKFQIFPAPVNGVQFAFEYVSNGWARSVAGVPKSKFSMDTDTCIYDDRLMTSGLIMKWKNAKKLDASTETEEFRRLLASCMGQDSAAAKIDMANSGSSIYIGLQNIPDSGYGGV